MSNEKVNHFIQGTPKPLLPVGGLPLITHWVDQIRAAKGDTEVCKVCVIINDLYKPKYEEWKSGLAVEEGDGE